MRPQSDSAKTEDLDRLLDAALVSYAAPAEAENTRTLATGVMTSVRHADLHRRQWRWGFAAAIPALSALLIAAMLFRGASHTPADSLSHTSPAVVAQPRAANPNAAQIRVLPQISPHNESHREIARLTRVPQTVPVQRNLPKLEQFPSPHTLSPQEALLEKFARTSAPAEKAAVVAAQQNPTQPLEIAAIRITPLTLDKENEISSER